MTSVVNRALYGKRHTATKQEADAAQVAEPVGNFPSPQFKENIKYLAYGSNLSAETFLGRRGIKPLSQVNVRAPSLTLCFDLAGVPYKEPRFANVRPREEGDQELIGVVYEVTHEDYITILKTEGGYSVIDVPCFPLTPVEGVASFESKTLIVPLPGTRRYREGVPSLRYLNLLLRGAEEHGLPEDYQQYLASTGYYHATTLRQKIGGGIVLISVLPVIAFVFLLRNLLSDKNGKAPKWLSVLQRFCFQNIWVMYDLVWKPLYGDGENDKQNVKSKVSVMEEAGTPTETDALLSKVEGTVAACPPSEAGRA